MIGTARFKKPKGATTPPWVDPWAAAIPGAVIVGAGANIGDGCGAWIYGMCCGFWFRRGDERSAASCLAVRHLGRRGGATGLTTLAQNPVELLESDALPGTNGG